MNSQPSTVKLPDSMDISWHDGGYYVSESNYPGGTVYTDGYVATLKARVAELEGALRALRLQALQSSVNDPANEWGLEALHQANAALSHAGPVARDGE